MAEPNPTPEPNAAAVDEALAAAAVAEPALQGRLDEAERKRDEYLDLLQRTKADFDNYQKRVRRELQEAEQYAVTRFARDLLPVVDNFQRATAAARQAGESGALVQGVAMVQNQLLDLLRRHGVTPIEAAGQPFDPNHHQAVMQRPAADVPPNTVLEVFEPGYLIHDRVLRPASVVVSTAVG